MTRPGGSALGRGWMLVALTIVTAWYPGEAPVLADDGQKVVEQCIQALGGREAWAAIDSMEIRGSLKTFSVPRPFRLVRGRPHQYRFEYLEDNRPVILGFDGEMAWWENAWTLWSHAPWAVEPPLVYQGMIASDAAFEPSFFARPGSGVEVEYQGTVKYELETYHKIVVHLPGGLEDEWYVDPTTFLPAVRVSPGADILLPWRKRTFLSDYREVGGIRLPYSEEIELGNRNRLLKIESVELDGVDPEVFRMPLSSGMERLRSFAGPWHVEVRQRDAARKPWQNGELDVDISAQVLGTVLVENATWIADGRVFRELRQYSYDRFRERFVVTSITSIGQYLEVLTGTVDESGAIVVSNLDSGTAQPAPVPPDDPATDPPTSFRRERLAETGDGGWVRQVEQSLDGGANWTLMAELHYRRP